MSYDMVLDASSLYARSFFASEGTFDSRVDTELLPARFALRTLLHLLNPNRSHLGVPIHRITMAWDGVRNVHKDRKPKPPGFHEGKERLQDILSRVLAGAQYVADEDCEADDLCASAAAQSDATRVYVVSGDKDLTQLHSPRVNFYDLNRKCLLTRQMICDKWQIKAPSHVAIALAIIGDTVDNIKGVPRWGPKKAAKLFESVPDEAPLDVALEIVTGQIPAELQNDFWAAFDRTLLKPDLPLILAPEPIVYAAQDDFDSLGLALENDYAELLDAVSDAPEPDYAYRD